MSDTGARMPDVCRLVDGKTAKRLVGSAAGALASDEQTPSSSECVWPPQKEKVSSGFIRVSAMIQKKTVKGNDPFSFAKGNFHSFATGGSCREIELNADESCWKEGGEGFSIVARKGYVVIHIICGDIKGKVSQNLPEVANSIGRFAVERI
ncbi:hypothetical protein [Actinomadura hibisca]|uniref:hypothetical protein n=1 Tax=Actinomadura hibisca TaxID=68565 RepID=UPI0012FC6BE0|nr:hypothetical protein [Actinomadura hibisca]